MDSELNRYIIRRVERKIIVMVDAATRWTLADVVRSADAQAAIGVVAQWQSIYGAPPQNVISDNGREFQNQAFVDYLTLQGVTKLWTPAYRPQANGLVE